MTLYYLSTIFKRVLLLFLRSFFAALYLFKMAYMMNSTTGLAHSDYTQLLSLDRNYPGSLLQTHTLALSDVGAVEGRSRVI